MSAPLHFLAMLLLDLRHLLRLNYLLLHFLLPGLRALPFLLSVPITQPDLSDPPDEHNILRILLPLSGDDVLFGLHGVWNLSLVLLEPTADRHTHLGVQFAEWRGATHDPELVLGQEWDGRHSDDPVPADIRSHHHISSHRALHLQ